MRLSLILSLWMRLYKWTTKVKVSNPTVIPEVQPFSKNCVHLHPADPVEDNCSLSSFNYNTHTVHRRMNLNKFL